MILNNSKSLKYLTVVYPVLLLEDCVRQRCCVLGGRESYGESHTRKELILVKLVQNLKIKKGKRESFHLSCFLGVRPQLQAEVPHEAVALLPLQRYDHIGSMQ